MNAEFDWWLLLVGIVGGAALVWLVVGDLRRRDDDLADDERQLESEWIADAFGAAGRDIDETTVSEVLELHRAYLAGPAPELNPLDEATTDAGTPAAAHTGAPDDRAVDASSPDEHRDELRAMTAAAGTANGEDRGLDGRRPEHEATASSAARRGGQPRQAPGDGS